MKRKAWIIIGALFVAGFALAGYHVATLVRQIRRRFQDRPDTSVDPSCPINLDLLK
jgi:hypothetical protein